MTDIVERLRKRLDQRLRKRIDPDDPDLWVLDGDRTEAADEIETLRAEVEQLKVSLVRICGMAHNDRRVLEVRPRDDVMPGAFIAKLKRPR